MGRYRYIVLLLAMLFCADLSGQESVNIWEGTKLEPKNVTVTPFALENPKEGLAVIVCPGGSYCWHDWETEGVGVAKWLNSIGISAFVLKYRVAGFWSYLTRDRLLFPRRQHPDMITDLQRTIQYVRENAGQFNIDPYRLGVMGFSAGGHLVMSSAIFSDTDFLSAHGIGTEVSLKPDFIVPVYPVVTMSNKKIVHKRSRRALLGESRVANRELRDSLSLEMQIPEDCPPVFLVNCKDDPIVRYQNSILLDSALTAKGIEHKYILYETGGHGFGADSSKTSSEAIAWKSEFVKWLGSLKDKKSGHE